MSHVYRIALIALAGGALLVAPAAWAQQAADSGALTQTKKTVTKKKTTTTKKKTTTTKKKTTRKAAPKKAAPKKAAKKAAKKPAKRRKKGPVTVPVDLGIGPAVHMVTGPIQDDQQLHYGVKISLAAIISQEIIKSQKHRIPKKYRGMATRMKEVRYTPTIFIPDTLFISPKTERTGMYGVNFQPVAINLPLVRSPRLAIGAGLDLTYIYIDSDEPALGTTHFLRPGLDLTADLEIPLSKSFLISVGWASIFYPPQEVGGEIFELGKLDDSIWHIGQAYLQLHFRFPYTVNL